MINISLVCWGDLFVHMCLYIEHMLDSISTCECHCLPCIYTNDTISSHEHDVNTHSSIWDFNGVCHLIAIYNETLVEVLNTTQLECPAVWPIFSLTFSHKLEHMAWKAKGVRNRANVTLGSTCVNT